eukprot:GHVS01067765.1.p1 GENE.GHVS01067765.1~~GHVS01067765.1.p1  ORF type:complete len:910 (-),score=231.54 GHVS01067765.1:604-3333(-)
MMNFHLKPSADAASVKRSPNVPPCAVPGDKKKRERKKKKGEKGLPLADEEEGNIVVQIGDKKADGKSPQSAGKKDGESQADEKNLENKSKAGSPRKKEAAGRKRRRVSPDAMSRSLAALSEANRPSSLTDDKTGSCEENAVVDGNNSIQSPTSSSCRGDSKANASSVSMTAAQLLSDSSSDESDSSSDGEPETAASSPTEKVRPKGIVNEVAAKPRKSATSDAITPTSSSSSSAVKAASPKAATPKTATPRAATPKTANLELVLPPCDDVKASSTDGSTAAAEVVRASVTPPPIAVAKPPPTKRRRVNPPPPPVKPTTIASSPATASSDASLPAEASRLPAVEPLRIPQPPRVASSPNGRGGGGPLPGFFDVGGRLSHASPSYAPMYSPSSHPHSYYRGRNPSYDSCWQQRRPSRFYYPRPATSSNCCYLPPPDCCQVSSAAPLSNVFPSLGVNTADTLRSVQQLSELHIQHRCAAAAVEAALSVLRGCGGGVPSAAVAPPVGATSRPVMTRGGSHGAYTPAAADSSWQEAPFDCMAHHGGGPILCGGNRKMIPPPWEKKGMYGVEEVAADDQLYLYIRHVSTLCEQLQRPYVCEAKNEEDVVEKGDQSSCVEFAGREETEPLFRGNSGRVFSFVQHILQDTAYAPLIPGDQNNAASSKVTTDKTHRAAPPPPCGGGTVPLSVCPASSAHPDYDLLLHVGCDVTSAPTGGSCQVILDVAGACLLVCPLDVLIVKKDTTKGGKAGVLYIGANNSTLFDSTLAMLHLTKRGLAEEEAVGGEESVGGGGHCEGMRCLSSYDYNVLFLKCLVVSVLSCKSIPVYATDLSTDCVVKAELTMSHKGVPVVGYEQMTLQSFKDHLKASASKAKHANNNRVSTYLRSLKVTWASSSATTAAAVAEPSTPSHSSATTE